MDVQGPVELLAVPLTTPLQVAQEVAETHSQRYLGVPELEEEGAQDKVRLEHSELSTQPQLPQWL